MSYALEIKNLNKVYNDGFTALHDINLTVEQGDFFALLGPNGAGKSTTIGIITSLINKTSGNVKVFGKDLDTELQAAQMYVGVVPQEFNFNPFEKVEDIIYNQAGFYGLSRHQVKTRVEYYLKKLDMWDKRKSSAIKLSGGMKRRLMIARAMIHEPKLLILDEPTAGVDLEVRRAMWTFIQEINAEKGVTIILTTHYLEEAEQMCKNIAIIDKGNVVKQTDMKSLLAQFDAEMMIIEVEGLDENVPLHVDGYDMTIVDAHKIELRLAKKQRLAALLAALEEQHIVVKNIRNKFNRLEELFLRLVKKD